MINYLEIEIQKEINKKEILRISRDLVYRILIDSIGKNDSQIRESLESEIKFLKSEIEYKNILISELENQMIKDLDSKI